MFRTYYLLTKPGIIIGNLINTSAGFLLASKGDPDFWLFLATLFGLGLVIASACVSNNYIDRNIDKKMNRTKKRALASGLISGKSALIFASTIGLIGAVILKIYTNPVALSIALVGFFIYVVLYGFWKRRYITSTLVGSIAGAVPPVVGYCAVSGSFDLGALLFFLILVFWQMPHFYAIAMYRKDEYAKANLPVLTVKKGLYTTKLHIILYIILYVFLVGSLSIFGYTGKVYLISSVLLGLIWLGYGINGLNTEDDIIWAKKMFKISLIVLTTTCVIIGLDSLLP